MFDIEPIRATSAPGCFRMAPVGSDSIARSPFVKDAHATTNVVA
ncbi:MAG TPA: hypothetical protein VK841_11750 [Polyangiaceae bacterium]|nr:hypothetical protein [Polyangiaceae bacterium]